MIVDTYCSEFYKDILGYLHSKFPDIPQHSLEEAASHITYKATIFTNDFFIAMQRNSCREIEKQKERRKQFVERFRHIVKENENND